MLLFVLCSLAMICLFCCSFSLFHLLTFTIFCNCCEYRFTDRSRLYSAVRFHINPNSRSITLCAEPQMDVKSTLRLTIPSLIHVISAEINGLPVSDDHAHRSLILAKRTKTFMTLLKFDLDNMDISYTCLSYTIFALFLKNLTIIRGSLRVTDIGRPRLPLDYLCKTYENVLNIA
jgi:hypothetical protein